MLLGDLSRNADCRVSTYPDCDPLIGWAVIVELVLYLPAIWLTCSAIPYALWVWTKARKDAEDSPDSSR